MKLCLLGYCCLVRVSFDFRFSGGLFFSGVFRFSGGLFFNGVFRFLGGLFFSGVCDNFHNMFYHDKLVDWGLNISVSPTAFVCVFC